MSWKKRLFLFAMFGCIGITTEIFFTNIEQIAHNLYTGAGEPVDWRLMGHSYVWMFPIYGLVAFFAPLLYHRIERLHVLLRALIYGVTIIAVEFVTGWLLDITTGSCPWDYQYGLHVMGYIRIDYLPLWMLFGVMVERLYLLLRRIDL